MSSLTRYLKLVKPAIDEVYDIDVFNNNYDKIDKAIGESVIEDSFVSEDEADPEELATMPEVMANGDDRATLFNKISVVVKNVRYLIKLIGNTDISEIGEGTITDVLSLFNSDLDDINNDLTELKGKIGMKCIKYGTISSSTTINLDETIDPEDYIVLLNTNAVYFNTSNQWTSFGDGAYISAKTSNSFTITVSSGISVDYQVVKLKP